MEQLNYAQVRDMLLYVAEQIIDSKALLTEVDSQIGDGDHGIGMERGMKKAKEKLLSMESGSNVYALFQEMGKTMLMSMGGASGVIFGTMFMAGPRESPSAAVSTARPSSSFWRGAWPRSRSGARRRWATRPWWTPWSQPWSG